MPHSPRPGACQAADGDIAALDNLQRGDQLLPPELRPARVAPGERGERADDALDDPGIGEDFAIGGFHPPDRHKDVAVHPVTRLDAVEQRRVLREHGAPGSYPLLGCGRSDIVPHRPDAFRLELCFLQHLRIGRHAGKSRFECAAGDAFRARRRPEIPDPAIEVGLSAGAAAQTAADKNGRKQMWEVPHRLPRRA
jgi:hypothetical protein